MFAEVQECCTFSPQISEFAKKKIKRDEPFETRISRVLEDRSNKLKVLSDGLESSLNSQNTFKPTVNNRFGSKAIVDSHKTNRQKPKSSEVLPRVQTEEYWFANPSPHCSPSCISPFASPSKFGNKNRSSSLSSDVAKRCNKNHNNFKSSNNCTPQASKSEKLERQSETAQSVKKDRLLGLYDEAFLRKNRQTLNRQISETQAELDRNTPRISHNSEQLVRQRRQRQIGTLWTDYCSKLQSHCQGEENIPPVKEMMNYAQLKHFLKDIGFFASVIVTPKRGEKMHCMSTADEGEEEIIIADKMWAAMNDNSEQPFVTRNSFVSVMLALTEPRPKTKSKNTFCDAAGRGLQISPKRRSLPASDLNTSHCSAAELNTSIESAAVSGETKPTAHGLTINNNNLIFALPSCEQTINSKKATATTDEERVRDCTFRPSIDSNSRKLESLSSPSRTKDRVSSLVEKDKRAKEKVIFLRQCKEQEELQFCTFKPTINSYRSSQTALFENGYRSTSSVAAEIIQRQETTEEKEVKAFCTFWPQRQTKTFDSVGSGNRKQRCDTMIAGYDDYVRRQKQAQLGKWEKEQVEANLKQGRPAYIDPSKWNAMCHSKQNPKPFSFHLDSRQRSKPLLYVDVNLGHGKNGLIGIHQNDEPSALAKNFATIHQLDDIMRSKLEAVITRHMQELLPELLAQSDQTKSSNNQMLS